MAKAQFYTADTIDNYFSKVMDGRDGNKVLPLHYSVEDGCLMLYGTDNIGELDEHSICRLGLTDLHYDGCVDVRGHLCDANIFTRGKHGVIRGVGYISGQDEEHPIVLCAEDGPVSLGDASHAERRMITYAHIEAEEEVIIYKRPLLHCVILSHTGDVMLRGQVIYHTQVQGHEVSISASSCKHMQIDATDDVSIKAGYCRDLNVASKEGDVLLCVGEVRDCRIEAHGNIDLLGDVDDATLAACTAHGGEVRYNGQVISGGSSSGGKGKAKSRKAG